MKNILAFFLALTSLLANAQETRKDSDYRFSSSIAESKQRGLFKRSYTVKQSLHTIEEKNVIVRGKNKRKYKFSEKDTSVFAIKECWQEETPGTNGKPERHVYFTLDERTSALNTANWGSKWAIIANSTFENRLDPETPRVYKVLNRKGLMRNKLAIRDNERTQMNDDHYIMTLYHLDFIRQR